MKYPIYNLTLCPLLWDSKHTLNISVRDALLRLSRELVDSIKKDDKLDIELLDALIVGSIANYNWTPASDIDLHVVIDTTQLKIGEIEATALFDAIKSKWNLKHCVKIKGHPVELYFELDTAKVESLAIYSIMQGKWIKTPSRENLQVDKKQIIKKYSSLRKRIESVLQPVNAVELESVLKKIYAFRQAGLDDGGEFSTENIVFKILRTQGYIAKAKNALLASEDSALSIK